MKRIIITAMILAFGMTAFGQVNFGLGVRAGLGFNTLSEQVNGKSVQEAYNELFSESDLQASVFNVGFNSGLFADVMFLDDKFGVQVEYMLSGEGTGVKFTLDGTSYMEGQHDFTTRFKMTNIPLLLKVKVKQGAVLAGIQMSSIREVRTLVGVASPDNKSEIWEKEYSDPSMTGWGTMMKDSWNAVVLGYTVEQNKLMIDIRATFGPEIGLDPDTRSFTPISGQVGIGYKLISTKKD